MKKLSFLFATLVLMLVTDLIYAQGLSISDVSNTADASSVLDVYSTSRGMLIPRLTSAQRTGIASPATGLMVFDTDAGSMYLYDGAAWVAVAKRQLWNRNAFGTYLANQGDFVGIGTINPGIYKLYVTDPVTPFSISRFDSQLEVWNGPNPAGSMLADINDFAVNNGVVQVYNNGNARIRLLANGNSFLNGGFVGVGTINPTNPLHVNNLFAPQCKMENPQPGDVAEVFTNNNIPRDFSVGIAFDAQLNTDHNFKICNTPALTKGLGYADPNTMYEIHTENMKVGITDINHQSRARVYQLNAAAMWGQIIPFALWQPVDFDMITYDEHIEWTPAPVGSSPAGGPATSFFTATEDGYYQVNARTDFYLMDPFYHEEVHNPNYPGFVSIAIYVNNQMYSQGNKLQGADNAPAGAWNDLRNNLAPNVSDVIWLQAGQTVEIYVWQDLWWNGLPLHTGPSQTYCSIHKVS
jgi:hypothetical protein